MSNPLKKFDLKMSKRIVCTTITKSHLAYARTLAETLLEHNPDAVLYVLLVDRLDDAFDPTVEPFKLIRLEELPDQNLIEQMTFYYTPFELCCALRGALHHYIFETLSAESWIFLDSDVMVCHSLEEIFDQLSEVSILLSPHTGTPVSIDWAAHEINFLSAGICNGGFLGLRRTDEACQFINWWKERLIYYSFSDLSIGDPRGLFVDQLWLNFVPLYFRDFKFLWHSGANIGHWNFHERQFAFNQSGTVTVDQQPLLFLHFSGWDLLNPYRISKYSLLPYEEQIDSPWGKMADFYREKLLKNGYEATSSLPYAFGTFRDGTPIDWTMRRGYYEELMQGKAKDGSPFDRSEHFQTQPYLVNSTQLLFARLQQADQTIHQLQAQVKQTQTALQNTIQQSQQQLQYKDSVIAHTQQRLQEIEKSKFWQLRNFWWKIKRSLGQSDSLKR